MSLRDKANINFSAGNTLKNAHFLYDPSIHCFYYTCIQEFLHIIFVKLGIPKQQFDQDRRNNRDGTHGWAYKLIQAELARSNDKSDFKWMQKNFPELKKLREEADYFVKVSSSDDSSEALRLTTSIRKILADNFK